MSLKTAREREKLTQEETAQKCDVSITTIRRMEQGIKMPGGRILRKLAKGLKCKIEELEG